jgi:uncharacterized protein
LTLLKEHYIPDFAVKFQKAGFAVLIYDHRGWGSSDGTPRNQTNPMQQAEDYHDAVLYARSISGVDKSRVAIWGIGHSGGASMIAAGDDPHVKAVVLVMPFTSGALDAANYPPGVLRRVWEDRESRIAQRRTEDIYVQVWDNSAEEAKGDRNQVLLHGDVAYQFINGAEKRSTAAKTPWENKMTLQSFYHIAKVEPQDHIYKISPRPLLYLAATVDAISGPIENQKKVFERAAEPKQFVTLNDHHVANYFGESFNFNINAQIEFLKVNL